MFHLYGMTKSADDIRSLSKNAHNLVGNIEQLPAVMPNAMAPIVRIAADGEQEIVLMRWGFTAPIVSGLKTRGSYLPNVHGPEFRLWRDLLETPAQRCLVPMTSFAVRQDPKRHWRMNWFARDESRPLMFCPGIWQEWRGNRGSAHSSNVGKHLVFSILTTDMSPDIPNNQHAVPVVLSDQTSCDLWMTAPIGEAILLQTPSPAGSFQQVAVNKRLDRREVAGRKRPRATSKASAAFLQAIRADSQNGEGQAQRTPASITL